MPTTTFYQKLSNVSNRAGINPRDLLLVMFLESGVSGKSVNVNYSKNPMSQARGLIQFMPQTLMSMGLSKEEALNFEKLPDIKQLDYVEKFVSGQRKKIGENFSSATQYYHANLFPATLKRWNGNNVNQNRNVVVVSGSARGEPFSKQERQAYQANGPYFDLDKKGYITVGDIEKKLAEKARSPEFQKMMADLNQTIGTSNTNNQMLAQKSTTKYSPELLSKFEGWLKNLFAYHHQDNYLIKFAGSSYSANLELANQINLALEQELHINSELYQDNQQVILSIPFTNDLLRVFAILEKYQSNFPICSNYQLIPKSNQLIKISVSKIIHNHDRFLTLVGQYEF